MSDHLFGGNQTADGTLCDNSEIAARRDRPSHGISPDSQATVSHVRFAVGTGPYDPDNIEEKQIISKLKLLETVL